MARTKILKLTFEAILVPAQVQVDLSQARPGGIGVEHFAGGHNACF